VACLDGTPLPPYLAMPRNTTTHQCAALSHGVYFFACYSAYAPHKYIIWNTRQFQSKQLNVTVVLPH
jgi:hypothetical protein